MAPTQLRYCICGATREAPASLRIVSCVRCGRALMSVPEIPAAPSIGVAQVAALASQVVGTLVFALALAWGVHADSDGRIAVGVVLVIGAVWVLAGGSALRGSLTALVWCALLDTALAVISLANMAGARGYLGDLVARTAPIAVAQVDTMCEVVGGLAALGALMCLAAIPQVRRMAQWQDARIELIIPRSR